MRAGVAIGLALGMLLVLGVLLAGAVDQRHPWLGKGPGDYRRCVRIC